MIDLIPEDYRRTRRLRRWLRTLCWACAGLAALAGLARLGLAHLVRAEQAELATLRQLQTATGAQRAKLADLQARKDAAERQIKTLEVLRGPAVLGELFFAIDTATTGKVWFNEFNFTREGEPVAAKPEAREAGRIIPVPPGAGIAQGGQSMRTAAEQAWRARPRAEIRGQALDHSTLAEFINRFGSQPGIGPVRLVDTRARNEPGMQVVEFELAALLVPADGAPR
jgi:hypothetical protein